MSTIRRLETLQAEKIRLKTENDDLVKRNKRLAAENKQLQHDIDMMRETVEATKKAVEGLRITYEESILTARQAAEKYTELYRDCLVLKKSLLNAAKI